jgi:hypothetical protein
MFLQSSVHPAKRSREGLCDLRAAQIAGHQYEDAGPAFEQSVPLERAVSQSFVLSENYPVAGANFAQPNAIFLGLVEMIIVNLDASAE